MKQIAIVLLLFLIPVTVHPQWFQHASIPTDTDLNKITFIDSFHGWILGDSGTILHTSDGGSTWEIQYYLTGVSFGDICMIDSLTGWLVGHGPDTSGYILKTTDGGNNWILRETSPHYLYDVCFTDSLHGWIIGEAEERMPCMLRLTGDGGTTWSETFIPDVMVPYDVIFTDSMTGFIGGAYHNGSDLCSRVLKTSDGGVTWQVKLTSCSDPFCFYKSLEFTNDSVGWLVGESWIEGIHGAEAEYGFIMATTNGGETWNSIFSDEIFPKAACPQSGQSGWAVGPSGLFMFTDNDGDDWEIMYPPPGEYLNDITFIDDDTGWAVGRNGTVMYTLNNGTMDVSDVPAESHALRIFPNPVKEECSVIFNMAIGGRVLAVLADLSGRTKAVILDKKLAAGSNRLTWHRGNNISPGIYLIRITFPSGSLTGKIALM